MLLMDGAARPYLSTMRRPSLQVKCRALIALVIGLCSVPACSAGTNRRQSQRFLSPTGLKEHQAAWEYALNVTEESAATFSQSYPGIIPQSWVQQKFLTEWKMRLVLEKALRGEEIRIGAVGGSITQGAGGVGVNSTYVAHLGRSLQEAFPSSNVSVHIGATTPSNPFDHSAFDVCVCVCVCGGDGTSAIALLIFLFPNAQALEAALEARRRASVSTSWWETTSTC